MRDERIDVLREVAREINKGLGLDLVRFDIFTSSIKYQELVLYLSVCEPFDSAEKYKKQVYGEVKNSLEGLKKDIDSILEVC